MTGTPTHKMTGMRGMAVLLQGREKFSRGERFTRDRPARPARNCLQRKIEDLHSRNVCDRAEPQLSHLHLLIRVKGEAEARMTALDRQKQDDDSRRSGADYDDSRRLDDSGTDRPYDSSDLDKVPRPTNDDPPYRSWWVI